MEYLKPAAFWLTVIGAINWGLVALLNLNVVTMFFSAGSTITTVIYVLIGVSGLYVAFTGSSKKKK